jgi:hypothetical protein
MFGKFIFGKEARTSFEVLVCTVRLVESTNICKESEEIVTVYISNVQLSVLVLHDGFLHYTRSLMINTGVDCKHDMGRHPKNAVMSSRKNILCVGL